MEKGRRNKGEEIMSQSTMSQKSMRCILAEHVVTQMSVTDPLSLFPPE